MTDHDRQRDFLAAERALVDYIDRAVPDATTVFEFGEWYAEIKGRRISLSAMALAAAKTLSISEGRP